LGRGEKTLNQTAEGLLKDLYSWLEEEILQYHLLGEELKKQSESLRKGSTEALIESLQSLEILTTAIRKVHGSILKTVEKILTVLAPQEEKKSLSLLMTLLPAVDSQKIESYLKTLEKLKKWSDRINERNKTYIQESLSYWKELISLLATPLADSPIYLQKGFKSSPAPRPYSLNRKV
jgi:hypothetical protein